MSLTHKIEKHSSGVVVFSLEGKIIITNEFEPISSGLEQQLNQTKRKFLVDISNVTHINSSGLNLLLRMFTKVRNKGGELVIVSPSASVEKLLSISKLDSIFTICADQTEALNNLNAQEA